MPELDLFSSIELLAATKKSNKFYMTLPQVMWVRQHCRLICPRCMQVSRANANQWGLIICEPCHAQGDDTGMFIADPDVVLVKEDGTRLTVIPDIDTIEAIT